MCFRITNRMNDLILENIMNTTLLESVNSNDRSSTSVNLFIIGILDLTRIHYYDTLTTANLFTAEEVKELL